MLSCVSSAQEIPEQGDTAASSDLPPDEQAHLDKLQSELQAAQAAHDQKREADILTRIGVLCNKAFDHVSEVAYFNRALPIYRNIGDRPGEARTLNNLGLAYARLGDMQQALDFHKQSVPIFHLIGDSNREARALDEICSVYSKLGEQQHAIDYCNRALAINRQMGDVGDEATTLDHIGILYSERGQQEMALDVYLHQSLPLFRQTGDQRGESSALNNIGLAYSREGEMQKALEAYGESLPISNKLGDLVGEAGTLNNIGLVYSELGENQQAIDYYNRAMALYLQVNDHRGEASTLNNIGIVYANWNAQQKAIDYYGRALTAYRLTADHDGEAKALDNLGTTYGELGETQTALDYYQQALPIYRQVSDLHGEAMALGNIGAMYSARGEKQQASQSYSQALVDAIAANDPLLEASTCRKLMRFERAARPAVAVFFGKEAVNYLQQMRGNMQGLDRELRASFLASKDDYYHELADLLIGQGRLPEGQQVLDLIKQREYSDYVRGENVNPVDVLTLTPPEQQASDEYQKSTTKLVLLSEQWLELRRMSSRSPEQEKQYQEISDQLDQASKGLNEFYERLYTFFGKGSDANKHLAEVKGDLGLLKQAIAKEPDTVALYTLVTRDGYKVIAIAGATMLEREYGIPEKELNQKVADFQQALRHPLQDPKPLAQELYKILVGPVKADLDQAHAQTLVWSLDGVLRYIPMAALYDGKQYLVENYKTVTITPVSIPHLAEKPELSALNTVAMGISRKYEDGLPPLPSVVSELNDIVSDSHASGANGVLPGTILLDGQFTERAMENQLGTQHGVVHIASHFVYKPGDDSQSYLLLAGKEEGGAGYHLTVADFRDNQKLALDDTDLLTLSACETGMSGEASNGREVDGLGTTAQLKGAKAVISSLWEVNDTSTGDLMADFYQRWAVGQGRVEKVEALREAQLDLLLGRVKPKSDTTARGVGLDAGDPPASFAHPYYWAPFVLMGNWK